jgi:hypothetical protein
LDKQGAWSWQQKGGRDCLPISSLHALSFFCFNGTGHSSEENPPDFGNEKLDERAAQKGKNYGPQADWAFQGECHKQGEYLPNCFGNHEAQPEALMEHIHELIDRSDGKLGLDVGGNTDGRKKQADPKN